MLEKENIVENLMAYGGLWCDNDIQSVKDILSKIKANGEKVSAIKAQIQVGGENLVHQRVSHYLNKVLCGGHGNLLRKSTRNTSARRQICCSSHSFRQQEIIDRYTGS